MRPVLLAILAMLVAAPVAAQFSSVRIQVVDVGQGDAVLIRTPNKQWVLIDAGTNNTLATNLGPVFGEPGDLTLLGSRTLEGLNVRIDPRAKRLVDAGPAPAATAA